jgi:hypothetical protein
LMSASPDRPAQPMAEITSGTGEQCREQVLDLVAGQADQPGRCWVAGAFDNGGHPGRRGRAWPRWSSGTRSASGGPDAGPSRPTKALAGLEALLDGPAASGDSDQGGQCDRGVASSSGRRPAPWCCGCGAPAARHRGGRHRRDARETMRRQPTRTHADGRQERLLIHEAVRRRTTLEPAVTAGAAASSGMGPSRSTARHRGRRADLIDSGRRGRCGPTPEVHQAQPGTGVPTL